MRYTLCFIFYLISVPIITASVIAADPEWVVPFEKQLELGIWDGRTVKKLPYLERQFKKYIDENKQRTIYMVGGHFYSLEHLQLAHLEIYSAIMEYENKKSFVKSAYSEIKRMSGQVIRIINDSALLFEENENHKWIILDISDDPYRKEIRLGKYISMSVIEVRQSEQYDIDDKTYLLSVYIPFDHHLEELNYLKEHCPPELTRETFLWSVYCRGVRTDFENHMVEADINCELCRGTGMVHCEVCGGQGKIVEEVPVLRRNSRGDKSNTRRKEPEASDSMSLMTPDFGIKSEQSTSGPKRKKISRCPVCGTSGWICCPKCILLVKPNYKANCMPECIDRWKDFIQDSGDSDQSNGQADNLKGN